MNKIISFFKEILIESYNTSIVLFKIMIPVSIFIKIFKETGLIIYIGNFFAPLMKYVGLPGETGLVWATGIISNLYGGIIAYFALSDSLSLNIAQITVMATMMLIAHNFPVELPVARKAGVRIGIIFSVRFFSAIIMGIFLNVIYHNFNLYQYKPVISIHPAAFQNPTLLQWASGEIKNYILIFFMILSLIFLLRILKKTGIIYHITKILSPVLNKLGIGEKAIPITIIGLTLGVAYGGAIIINESKNENIPKRDVFSSIILMGLCHSIIEDSLVMLSIGANISGIIIGRMIFAFIFTWFIVKTTSKISSRYFLRFFVTK
ncbi:MAG: nucleoside recognition domain-containing protein [Bacteroidota bacterium]|nr:nucleoside recognition domain-containing protein [Bacteroidota bacterium]